MKKNKIVGPRRATVKHFEHAINQPIIGFLLNSEGLKHSVTLLLKN